MIIHSYSDEGIVLARRNYGEADRILSVFSKKNGRMSYLAKGVRRPSSKKRGHIEVFGHIIFQAVKTRGIDLITEVETVDGFQAIRKNLKKASLAYYFMEAVGRSTQEGEGKSELFKILSDYLEKLKEKKQLKALKRDFVYALITSLGFWPKGKPLVNPENKLEEIIERQLSSARVGKRMFE